MMSPLSIHAFYGAHKNLLATRHELTQKKHFTFSIVDFLRSPVYKLVRQFVHRLFHWFFDVVTFNVHDLVVAGRR
jgi:hypothetical protein